MLGFLLWHVAGEIGGDGFFHLARVRKLVSLGDLSLHRVDEFPDGGLHPGYAFPLWHGFLALVAKVGGVDPADVVLHEPSILAPLAVLAWYEAGWALFRGRSAALATAAASAALGAMAPGHGGAFMTLALPATVSQQAARAGCDRARRRDGAGTEPRPGRDDRGCRPRPRSRPSDVRALRLIPFAGFLVVRWAWAREDVRSGLAAAAALALPAGAFVLWLIPILRDTASVEPGAVERARGLRQYATQLVVSSPDSFHLAPQVLARSGAVAVAGLALVPLAALAARRRWAAYVVGGSLAVLATVLISPLFVRFSDVVSLSQSRRLAAFVPFAFAFAGGLAVATRLLRDWVVPSALAAGIGLQIVYPGDFGYVLHGTSPAWPAWVAAVGGAGALAVGVVLARRGALERPAALAALVFLAPVFVHGFRHWSPSTARPPSPLTAGLVGALRHQVPEGAIVYSDPETSYRVAASAPVYICVAPPGHVANTKQNRPYERVLEFRSFVRARDLVAPRACGAGWLVVDEARFGRPAGPLTAAYRDARYVLYRIGA